MDIIKSFMYNITFIRFTKIQETSIFALRNVRTVFRQSACLDECLLAEDVVTARAHMNSVFTGVHTESTNTDKAT